jgi:hypothetical protein
MVTSAAGVMRRRMVSFRVMRRAIRSAAAVHAGTSSIAFGASIAPIARPVRARTCGTGSFHAAISTDQSMISIASAIRFVLHPAIPAD